MTFTGAYHDAEIAKWKENGREGVPPVFTAKDDTDNGYLAAVSMILWSLQDARRSGRNDPSQQPEVVALFGTHNSDTMNAIADQLKRRGLTTRSKAKSKQSILGTIVVKEDIARRIAFGQLYGESICHMFTRWMAGRLREEICRNERRLD